MTRHTALRLNPTEFPTGARHEVIPELALPGPIPFVLERLYRTGDDLFGPLGADQLTALDVTIRDNPDGGYLFTDLSGIPLPFDAPEAKPGAQTGNPGRKDLVFEPLPRSGFRLRDKGLTHDFELMEGRIWRLVLTTDRVGRTITYKRNRAGLLDEVILPTGLRLEFQNDEITGLRMGYDLIGRDGTRKPIMRYSYDAMHRLTVADNAVGAGQRYTFRDAAREVITTDDRGFSTLHRFDSQDRVIAVESDEGYHAGQVTYHDDRDQITLSHGDGTEFEKLWFDEQGRHFMSSDARGRFSYREFTDQNDLSAQIDPNGNAMRYRVDPFGNPEAIIDGEGRENFMVWSDMGDLLLRKTPAGGATRYAYDDRGLLRSVTNPLGHETAFSLDDNGLLRSTMRHDGLIEFRDYDAYGRLTSLIDFASAETRFTYDSFDRPVEIIDPAGGVTRLAYDGSPGQPFDAPHQVTRADGVTITRMYGVDGLVETLQDGEGRATRYEFGGYGTLQKIIDPKGGTLSFTYDSRLRLTCVTNQAGLKWSFERNVAGQVVSETDFDGRTLRYTLDDMGRVIAKIAPDDSRLEYDYDKSGLLTELRAYTAGADDPVITTYEYDDNGTLIGAENPDARIDLTRDASGRVTSETVNDITIESTLSCCGDRTERRIADQHLEMRYGGMGDLVEWQLDKFAPLTFNRDALGREVERRSAGGFTMAQTWDAVGQLTAQTGSEVDRSYDWSRAYEPTRISDARFGEKRYAYDKNGQIAATRHGDGTEERFNYNADLNLSGSGDLSQFMNWETSAAGVVKLARGPRGERVMLDHDACGRVTKRTVLRDGFRPKVWTFDWNAQDQMIAAHCPDGAVWRYAYDPFGRRISKETKGTRHDFLWDGDVIARETINGHAVDWFFEPKTFRPLARLEDGVLSYVVNDHLGTPKEVVSEHGALLWAADHDTWGSIRPLSVATGTGGDEDYWLTLAPEDAEGRGQTYTYPPAHFCPIRFQGQWEDGETGLYYNEQRFYDPIASQYTSPDPIGASGGLSLHGYVIAPNTWTDPHGFTGVYLFETTEGTCYVGKGSPTRQAASERQRTLEDGSRSSGQSRDGCCPFTQHFDLTSAAQAANVGISNFSLMVERLIMDDPSVNATTSGDWANVQNSGTAALANNQNAVGAAQTEADRILSEFRRNNPGTRC